MLRKLILFITLIWTTSISAQEIKVVRFGIIPGDNSAETSPRQDLSDNLCALVKVKANGLTGLQFTNKNQYVGDVVFKDGIYYVYIPTVTNKLSFSHESYLPGVIDMALFGYKKSIKGGKTYEAILEPSSLKPSITGISFKISPHVRNGSVIVDNQVTPLNYDGILKIDCKEGVHRYQVKAENYKPVAGTVKVTNRYEPVIITLQPQTVPVNIGVTPDYAHIYVDNIDYGKSGIIQLPLGKHSIRVSAKGYLDHVRYYFITKNVNQIPAINLNKNKGKVETIYPVEVYVECNSTKLYKNNKAVEGNILKIMPGTKCRLSDDFGKGDILKVPANQRKPMRIKLSNGHITILEL